MDNNMLFAVSGSNPGIKELITFQLVHGNYIHLIVNMFSFLVIGNYIETKIQKKLYIQLLTYSFAFSAIATYIMHHIFKYENPVVGFSGVVVGLYLVYLVMKNGKRGLYLFLIEMLLYHLFMYLFTSILLAWYVHLGGTIGVLFALLFCCNQNFIILGNK